MNISSVLTEENNLYKYKKNILTFNAHNQRKITY